MKKILNTIVIFLLVFTISACNKEGYNGPTFIGVNATSDVKNVEEINLSKFSSKSNLLKLNGVLASEEEDSDAFITTRDTPEWLVVHINQPEEVINYLMIQTVTISTTSSDGVLLNTTKWTSITNAEDGREMYMDPDGTKVFIPIITPNTLGSFTYEVEGLQYTDSENLNQDVRKADGSIDSVIIYIGYHNISYSNMGELNIGGVFSYNESYDDYSISIKTSYSFVNPDNVPLESIEIHYYANDGIMNTYLITKDELYETGIDSKGHLLNTYLLNDGSTRYFQFYIDGNIIRNLNLSEWKYFKITLTYSNGVGWLNTFETHVIDNDLQGINVDSYEQLNMLSKNFSSNIYLTNDIIIPSDFVAFDSTFLGFKSEDIIHSIIFADINTLLVRYTDTSSVMDFQFSTSNVIFNVINLENITEENVVLNIFCTEEDECDNNINVIGLYQLIIN